MKFSLALPLLVCLLITLAAPADAHAAEVFRITGEVANLHYQSTTGCIRTSIYVTASNQRTQSPPARSTAEGWVNVGISRVDQCQGYRTLFMGSGQRKLTEGEFEIDSSLRTASLRAEFHLHDVISSSDFDLSLDLAWTDDGYRSRANNHYIYDWPGYWSSYRSNGTYQAARFTGFASLGDAAPLPVEGEGSLESTRSGSVSIETPR